MVRPTGKNRGIRSMHDRGWNSRRYNRSSDRGQNSRSYNRRKNRHRVYRSSKYLRGSYVCSQRNSFYESTTTPETLYSSQLLDPLPLPSR